MKYRLVNKGEIIQDGDEWWGGNGAWSRAKLSVGGKLLIDDGIIRRKMEEGELDVHTTLLEHILDELRKNTSINEQAFELAKELKDALKDKDVTPEPPQDAPEASIEGFVGLDESPQQEAQEPYKASFKIPEGYRALKVGEEVEPTDTMIWSEDDELLVLGKGFEGYKAGQGMGWDIGYGDIWLLIRKEEFKPYRVLEDHEVVQKGDTFVRNGVEVNCYWSIGHTPAYMNRNLSEQCEFRRYEWKDATKEIPEGSDGEKNSPDDGNGMGWLSKEVELRLPDGKLDKGVFYTWDVLSPRKGIATLSANISRDGVYWREKKD